MRIGILFLVYFLTAKLGLMLDAVSGFATLVWPPTGIALAALLIYGYRLWPGITAAAFFVNFATGAPLLSAAGIAVGNTLEAVLGAALLQVAGFNPSLDRLRDVYGLAFWSALLSTAVSATLGVASLWAGQIIDVSKFVPTWKAWWVGDMLGALIMAPLLLTWHTKPRVDFSLRRAAEMTALVSAFLAAISAGLENSTLIYLIFLPMLWSALRFGQRGAVTAVFGVSIAAIWTIARGWGPFSARELNESLFYSQLFMGIAALTSMTVAAIMTERLKAETGLHDLNLKLEERVKERTAQLESANRELRSEISRRELTEGLVVKKQVELARSKVELEQLELFAHVTSHDLQEPLHKIITLGDILLRQSAPGMDTQGRDMIQRMQSSAARMGQMIRQLRELSRISSEGRPFDWVNLQRALEEVLVDLEIRIKETGARVHVGPLPTVRGDKVQLQRVFQNLISNAIKFRRGGMAPEIQVTARDLEKDLAEISVQDNGIGFDQKYAEQIFKPFQRLHDANSYEGTGIGLTICQKIALRHGGKITARSVSGKGSVFALTLPRGN
jgi:signal transduction histidine kinase